MRWGVFVEPARLVLDSLRYGNNEQNQLAQKDHIRSERYALYHPRHGYCLYQAEVLLPGRLQMNQ